MENNFFIISFNALTFSIQKIMAGTKLTRIEKIRNQIDTIEKLKMELKYGVKDMD